jgi:hypothetical protein
MFFVIGVDHAPMVKGKMKNDDFSLSAWKWFFYPHIFLGMISLAIGPFQLTKKSQRNPKLHKTLGKIYAVAVFINILMVFENDLSNFFRNSNRVLVCLEI